MTSYYDVFEVAPGDEPSGVSEGDSEWNPSDVMCLVKNSWATWRGWEGGRGDNWSWDDRSMGGESQRSWSDWSGRAGRARVYPILNKDKGLGGLWMGSANTAEGEYMKIGHGMIEQGNPIQAKGMYTGLQRSRSTTIGGHRPAPDQRQVHERDWGGVPDPRPPGDEPKSQGNGRGKNWSEIKALANLGG